MEVNVSFYFLCSFQHHFQRTLCPSNSHLDDAEQIDVLGAKSMTSSTDRSGKRLADDQKEQDQAQNAKEMDMESVGENESMSLLDEGDSDSVDVGEEAVAPSQSASVSIEPVVVPEHSDDGDSIKEQNQRSEHSEIAVIAPKPGTESEGMKVRNERNLRAQSLEKEAVDGNTNGGNADDVVLSSYQIVKWLNRIEDGKFLDLKFKKFKEMVRAQNVNIFRVSMVSSLVLRMCGIEDPEDIHCILNRIERLVDSQGAVLRISTEGGGVEDYYTQNVPVEFLCPLSLELMTDPVLATTTGLSYQRQHIEHYLKRYRMDPVERKETSLENLAKNKTLKELIVKWMEQNQ